MLYNKPAEMKQETNDETSNPILSTNFISPCSTDFSRIGCIQSQSILEDQIINLRS